MQPNYHSISSWHDIWGCFQAPLNISEHLKSVSLMTIMRSIKLSILAVSALWVTPFAGLQAQSFVDLAVGEVHLCGLTDAGEVECVTQVGASRFNAPDDLPQLTAISGGFQHSCGITVDGGAVCWGSPAFGALDVPDFDAPLVSISAGTNHTCAIDELNRAVCWGLNDNLQTEPPGDGFGENGLGFIAVSANQNTSCGIELDGSISCWSTDPTLLDTSSLTGTFVDLDMGENRFGGCGLTDTGDIQCWQGSFEPPNNGPYTDLTVSSAAICGLNQSQQPDCTFNPRVSSGLLNDPALFETTSQFVSLEAFSRGGSVTSFGGPNIPNNNNVCGITVNSTLECLDVSAFTGVPDSSQDIGNPELEINLDLTAIISPVIGFARVELIWTQLSGGIPRTFIEVFRDDELIATTTNRFSFEDTEFFNQRLTTASYRIRATDEFGNVGEFSNTISVDATDLSVTGGNTLSLEDANLPSRLINSINVLFLSGSSGIVSWDGPPAGENGLQGYEIRVNNETIEFTSSSLFRFENLIPNTCVTFAVAAISDNNAILDFRTTTRRTSQATFGVGNSCTSG